MLQCMICHPPKTHVTEGYICRNHADRRLREGAYRVTRNGLEGPFAIDEGFLGRVGSAAKGAWQGAKSGWKDYQEPTKTSGGTSSSSSTSSSSAADDSMGIAGPTPSTSQSPALQPGPGGSWRASDSKSIIRSLKDAERAFKSNDFNAALQYVQKARDAIQAAAQEMSDTNKFNE